jgi:hypothetical protein
MYPIIPQFPTPYPFHSHSKRFPHLSGGLYFPILLAPPGRRFPRKCSRFHIPSFANNASWQLTQSDPVHAVNVVEFIKHHLTRVQGENGGPDRFREDWVVNVDKYVLEGFAKLGVI